MKIFEGNLLSLILMINKQLSKKNNKLIVVVGPTASGKSELAVRLAKKFNGEIISADSRQVYKQMDIGSGKITKKERKGIPHYLLDVASPKRKFTVAQYRKLALGAINYIQKRAKIPILVGGTGFYVDAVVFGQSIPQVKPDWTLRKKLSLLNVEKLHAFLKKRDPKTAERIDARNLRRLVRAVEIVIKTGKPVPKSEKHPLPCSVLFLGLKKSGPQLKKLIAKRLSKRLKEGMINEVRMLKKSGISWKRIEEFGLEYRCVAQFLQNKITCDKMRVAIQKDSERFARRQMAWFGKNKRIKWIGNFKQALSLAQIYQAE